MGYPSVSDFMATLLKPFPFQLKTKEIHLALQVKKVVMK